MKDAKNASIEELLIDIVNCDNFNSFLIVGILKDDNIIVLSKNKNYIGIGKTFKIALINFQLNILKDLFTGKARFPNDNGIWKEINWKLIYENWLLEAP